MHKFLRQHHSYFKGLLLTLVTWGTFFVVVWMKVFVIDDKGIRLWAYMDWDWPAHFAYASWFAYQPPHTWLSHHPLFLFGSFSYPFVADAISGLLMRIGVNLHNAFLVPSILTSLLLIAVLYTFYYQIIKHWVWSVVATCIFLTSGGLGFWYFFKDASTNGLINTLSSPSPFYTFLDNTNISWLNVVISEFFPQRTFLLGIPVTLFIVILLRRWSDKQFKGTSSWKVVLLGICAGLLPTIHLHSYLALIVITGILFVLSFSSWKRWMWFVTTAGLTSLIPVSLMYQSPLSNSTFHTFFTFHFGVHTGGFTSILNMFNYWLLNWGVFFVLVMVNLFLSLRGAFMYRHSRSEAIPSWWFGLLRPTINYLKDWARNDAFLAAGLLLFLIGNFIQLQPYAWDNRKILLWSYLVLTIPIVVLLRTIWQKKLGYKILTIFLILGVTLSGAIDVTRMLTVNPQKHSNVSISTEEIELGAAVRKLSTPSDIVILSDKRAHPVPALTGNQVLMGYSGLVAPFDFIYLPVATDVQAILTGSTNALQLLSKYKVSFVVLGPSDYKASRGNFNYYNARFPLVYNSKNYRVYSTKSAWYSRLP